MATCEKCIHQYVCAKLIWKEKDGTLTCEDFRYRHKDKMHTHWIIYGDWGECSNCHESSKLAVLEHKDFCGACGAAMDEESVVVE